MTYDRAALDLVGTMTDTELADFIRQARQPVSAREQLAAEHRKLADMLAAVDPNGNLPTTEETHQ